MEYWRGMMDWPIDKDWVCETCGQTVGLEWGMVHAECRCNSCHTLYYMRAGDKSRTILTKPLCILKEEYKEPAIKAWGKYHIPVDELTGEQWDGFMEKSAVKP